MSGTGNHTHTTCSLTGCMGCGILIDAGFLCLSEIFPTTCFLLQVAVMRALLLFSSELPIVLPVAASSLLSSADLVRSWSITQITLLAALAEFSSCVPCHITIYLLLTFPLSLSFFLGILTG